MNFNVHKLRNTLKLILSCILSFVFFQTKSQDLCQQTSYVKGDFELSSTTLCLPQMLTVSDKSGGISIKYVFDYQGENLEEVKALSTSQITFDYVSTVKKPETFTILQIGNIAGKVSIACKNITVRPSNVPIYSYTACGSSLLAVNIPQNSFNNFDNYEITIEGAATSVLPAQLPFQLIKTVTMPTQLKVVGKYNDASKGCATPVSNVNVPAYILVTGGIDRPFNPNISQLKLETPSKASLTFTGAYNNSNQTAEHYKLYTYPNGTLPNLNNVIISDIIPGKYTVPIPDSTKSYCFFVQRDKSICGFITEWSSELCTHPLKKVAFVPYQNNLEWAKYPNMLFGLPNNLINNIAVNQQIERIENSSTVSPISISQNAFTYSDNTIDCKNKYCYRLKINTTGQVGFLKYSGQSISNMICVNRSELIANAPTDVYVSANSDNQNAVFFDKTPNWPIDISRWILYKKEDNQYKKIDSLANTPDFVLDKTTAAKAESYKISYVDKCESKSTISDSVSSVFMSFQDPNSLSWNSGRPFDKSGIGLYEVEYLEETSSNIMLSKEESATHHEADLKYYEENAKFRLKIVSDGSPTKTSYSNILKVEVPSNLVLPNIFTPNGDASNDLFGVKGKSDNLQYFSLEIFNRFGEKVVQFSNAKDNWDGKIKGKAAPVGIYFYKMSAKLKNGEVVEKDGTLELIR